MTSDILTIHDAAAAIRAGTLTPVDLLEQCLERIDRYEPKVRAWVVVDRDGARLQAERLTAELREREFPRSPLHGIPVGIKDIIDVADLPTACGSKSWANSIARQDAVCVEKLRSAGAVILGKTVTTPYAFLDPPVTRNPWDYNRTPGGSSSGSAAAVACGMAFGALGTQTGGSITRPAVFCGVCSLKPSWGRVSAEGVLPLAPSLDHVGVMARRVRDLGTLFQIVAGDRLVQDVARFKWPHAQPVRIGWLGGPFDDLLDRAAHEQMDLSRRLLTQKGGAEIIDVALPAAFADVWRNHRSLMAAEAAYCHRDRFRRRPDDFPPRITALIEEGLRLNGADMIGAFMHREEVLRQVTPLFEELDVLVTPAAPGPAPARKTTGDAVFNAPWSYLRLPTVSFPIAAVGSHGTLPIGVQLVGKPAGERELLAVAAWCEEQVNWVMGWPPEPE